MAPGPLRAPPPCEATLHRQVQQHAGCFIAHTDTGSELPRFIKDVFEAFLECSVLAHRSLRLRCREYGHDKLLLGKASALLPLARGCSSWPR